MRRTYTVAATVGVLALLGGSVDYALDEADIIALIGLHAPSGGTLGDDVSWDELDAAAQDSTQEFARWVARYGARVSAEDLAHRDSTGAAGVPDSAVVAASAYHAGRADSLALSGGVVSADEAVGDGITLEQLEIADSDTLQGGFGGAIATQDLSLAPFAYFGAPWPAGLLGARNLSALNAAINIRGDNVASRLIRLGQQVTFVDEVEIDVPAANFTIDDTTFADRVAAIEAGSSVPFDASIQLAAMRLVGSNLTNYGSSAYEAIVLTDDTTDYAFITVTFPPDFSPTTGLIVRVGAMSPTAATTGHEVSVGVQGRADNESLNWSGATTITQEVSTGNARPFVNEYDFSDSTVVAAGDWSLHVRVSEPNNADAGTVDTWITHLAVRAW
jgi:hypothetical protein